MRAQRSGVILMISSISAYEIYPFVTYKATKAALIAFTQQQAINNAEYGIRANAILPGLMDTPMGVDRRAQLTGRPGRDRRRARGAGATQGSSRDGLGCRQRGAVPGLRRSRVRDRRGVAGGWRGAGADGENRAN